RLREALEAAAFATGEAAKAALLASDVASAAAARVREHREREAALRARSAALAAKLGGRVVTPAEWAAAQAELRTAEEQREAALQAAARAEHALSELTAKHARWSVLEQQRAAQELQRGRLHKLQSVLKANALVEFLAEEQLLGVSRAASERLGKLTRRRYALEVDSSGGFVIRDDANGGVKRPVSTLSGGETFLTSLALALALSAQIQLKGEYPLEFFFLDEGFGTLDGDLLDTVVTALERLHTDRVAVGVISHVPELKARLPRKIIVHPAEASGRGSRIELEES
ncbi:SMC family ATPase, partial [Paenibacillus albiflavus]